MKSIGNAISMIYQGDKAIVYFSFYKNITEAVFDAFYDIYLIKFIYESIENGVDFRKLFLMVSIFCIIHVVIHFTSAFHSYCLKISEMKVYRNIFQKIIHRAKKIEISQYENPKFYDKFSRALDESLEQGIWGMIWATCGVGAVFGSITALFMLASVDVMLIAFVIPPVIGSLWLGIRESGELFAARREETVAKRKMEYAKRVFYEKKYASELRLYPIADTLFGIHRDGYLERYEKNKSHHRKIGLYRIIETLLFAGLVTLCSYLYIAYRLKVSGSSAVAAYVAMIAAVGYVVGSISEAIEFFSEAGKQCMYMQNITEFMECEIEESVDNAVIPETNIGDIEFEHVSYHYSGSEEKDKDRVRYALEQSGFLERLHTLPKGMDTMLTREFTEDGIQLSGGEAQKVAIARLFAKKERMHIAILDEPSSALDPKAEYELNKNILNKAGDATIIFISHRLSTTRDADCIYMFENGEIIEQGTHQELMELNGQYADMFRCQAKYYQQNQEIVC